VGSNKRKQMVNSPYRLNHSDWRDAAAVFIVYHGPQTADALGDSVKRLSGKVFKHQPNSNSIANILRIDKRFDKAGKVIGHHGARVTLWGLNEQSPQIIELRERIGIEK